MHEHQYETGLWFSADLDTDGGIKGVWHDRNEMHEVLQIKKAIATTVLAKLRFATEHDASTIHNYTVEERDTSGLHTATYHAASTEDGKLQFRKVRAPETKRAALTTDRHHEKVIVVDSQSRQVERVNIKEGYAIPLPPLHPLSLTHTHTRARAHAHTRGWLRLCFPDTQGSRMLPCTKPAAETVARASPCGRPRRTRKH